MDTIVGGAWLPHQDLAWKLVTTALERVRELVEQHQFGGLPDSICLTASIGVLPIAPGDQRELRDVLATASTAMQSAKRGGKNRVTLL